MFEDLFNHSKEREPLQALGFYIVFFIIGLALGAFGGAVFASDFETGMLVGHVLAVAYCTILSFLILSAKGQLSNAHFAFIFLTAYLSYSGGALGGLIPVAYLTTINNLKS